MKRPVVAALNPSIDAEWQVDGVRWEEKNNVLREARWAGGKGVNVARWLHYFGARPRMVLPLGGDSGLELAAGLRARHIAATVVPIHDATRVNVIVTTPKQGQLRFNPLGPRLSRAEWAAVLVSLRSALVRAGFLVLSGSLPRGLPANTYARLTRLARSQGVPVLLDCDGQPLAAAVRAHPFLVKPNEHELLEWARHAGLRFGPDAAGVRSAACALSRVTRGWVLVSRGPKPGLLVNEARAVMLQARPPQVKPRTTVGAGDALLAAVTHQILRGAPPGDWLKAGLEAGAAATQLPAGQLPR